MHVYSSQRSTVDFSKILEWCQQKYWEGSWSLQKQQYNQERHFMPLILKWEIM